MKAEGIDTRTGNLQTIGPSRSGRGKAKTLLEGLLLEEVLKGKGPDEGILGSPSSSARGEASDVSYSHGEVGEKLRKPYKSPTLNR